MFHEIAYRKLLRKLRLRRGRRDRKLLLIDRISAHALLKALERNGGIAAHAKIVVKLLRISAKLAVANSVDPLAIAAKV